jgi:hypothetical protein
MQDTPTEVTGTGKFYGAMAIDHTVQRLDAHPVNTERSSVFMSSSF